MAIEGMTEAEVALLTPEERAALEDPTPDAAQVDDAAKKAALAADAAGGIVDDDDDQNLDATDLAAAKAALAGDADAAKAAAAAADKGADDAATKQADGKERVFMPTMPTAAARDFDAEEAALVKKYEEGEVNEADYRKGLREIVVAQTEAQHADKFNTEVQKQVWENEVAKFIRTNAQYKQGTVMYSALGRALELEGAAEGADNLAGDELLARAHKRVMAEFGITPPASKDSLAAPKRPSEDDARKLAPKTLADVPAADLQDMGGGKFAHLDNLDGLAFENALARLSEGERDAYLNQKA